MDDSKGRLAVEYLALLITHYVTESRDPEGAWQPVTLTAADLETMDQLDVDQLEDLVLRLRTPEQ